MQKRKENQFAEKFRLLNSQENTENINWSSSDSSEFENISHNDKLCKLASKSQRKRKRKKKVHKNISNLSVTILDTSKGLKEAPKGRRHSLGSKKAGKNDPEKSPVFPLSPKFFPPYKAIKQEPTSPILTCKSTQNTKANISDKSPILLLKHCSQKVRPKIKRTLFNMEDKYAAKRTEKDDEGKEQSLDRRKCEKNLTESNNNVRVLDNVDVPHNERNIISDTELQNPNSIIIQPDKSEINNSVIKIETSSDDLQENNSSKSLKLNLDLENSFTMLKTTNSELVNRVQAYFENHFSSENASQCSINDTPTPKNNSKNSEDVEIVSIISQVNSNRNSIQSEQSNASKNPSPLSSQSAEFNTEKHKKIRYKKDGLAYRLNVLLKKQTANISLWQHERFLAANSNFVIPKGEHLVFRIQNVCFKYGVYVLSAINADDALFYLIINSAYVHGSFFLQNMVLKLYEPYKILDFNDDYKLVINICKFECIDLSN